MVQHIKDKYTKSVTTTMLLTSILLIWASPGYSDTASVNFNVKVTIAQETCVVNDNNPIAVDFKMVVIKNIDGINYQEDIPYTLDCPKAALSQKLRLQFSGTGSNFNKDILRTSENDLGLRFRINDVDMDLNSWQDFSYGSLPKLTVVPYKSSLGGISAGEFNASATFSVEYP